MELLDRYVRVLRLFLPRGQRDDIVREISEEIREQLLEQEMTLGRQLTVDEQAEVIGRYGHPLITAARYRPQQHLIGPIVFPYYRIALKFVLAVMLFGHAVSLVVIASNDPSWSVVGAALEGVVQNVFAVIAWFTVLAAVADRWLAQSKVLHRWDPQTLMQATSQAPRLVDITRRRPMRARAATLLAGPSTTFGLITAVVLSGWWLVALRYPMLMFGSGAAQLDWGPDMRRLYPLLVATAAVFLTQRLAKVLWLRQRWLLQVTGWVAPFVGALFVVGVASSENKWVVSSQPAVSETVAIGGLALSLLDFVNLVFALSFGFAGVVTVLSLARRAYQWRSGKRNGGVRSAPAICLMLLLGITGSIAHAQSPDDAAIHRILEERIDARKQSVGIVVGIVTPQGRRVVQHGRFAPGDPREVGPDTVFEIGSVTKVFTAMLLADMARKGEVGVTDPIVRYLPADVAARAQGVKATTLADLATHTAGFPFWPSGIPATAEGTAQMASYSVDQLYQFIATFEAPADAAKRWMYSNTDVGLLGELLARRAGSTYDALIESRITRPLGMTSTAIAVAPALQPRLAIGHNADLKPAPAWNVPTLAAGGSLHSTVNDLLMLLAAIGDPTTVAGAAMPGMLAIRRQAPGFQQALGWMVLGAGPGEGLLLHDGNTLGFASSVVYDPVGRIGVVVLSNSSASVSDIARHVARPAMPLAAPLPPAPLKTEISVEATLFDTYAGVYEPGPGAVFTVTREGDALMIQIPGIPKLRLRPESTRDFFVAENTRVTVTFNVDAAGRVTGLLLKAPTGNVPAVRRP
jgi:D-alanyl-D-alanine-carboxypeptidase/D-alanyl-D-alanine-endopeptidase